MAEPPSSPHGSVLVVDDDADVVKSCTLLLARRGFQVASARSPAEALSVIAAQAPDAVLLDLNFSRAAVTGEEGLAFLRELLAANPRASVVVITGHSGVNVAVAAMRAGALDFVMKPWSNERLVSVVEAAVAARRRGREGTADPARAGEPLILGQSEAAERFRGVIARAAPTEAAVLLHGPPGVGKSLAARVLHRRSRRAAAPFVVLDGASADPQAVDRAWGEAQAATLLVEEPASLSLGAQARLGVLLDAGETGRPRLVATSRASAAMLRGPGGLRADLLGGLASVEAAAPTLSERHGDAEFLAEHFLRLFAGRYGLAAPALEGDAREAVARGPWPDEVRGLRTAAERAVVLGDVSPFLPGGRSQPSEAGALQLDLNLERAERGLIEQSLRRHAFNVSRAAADLGLTRAALYRRMSKHGL